MLFGMRSVKNLIDLITVEAIGEKIYYKDLLCHSWPLWINALTTFILSQSSLWIIGLHYTGINVAGFGAANKLILLTSMSLVTVNMVLPPLIAKYNALKKKRIRENTQDNSYNSCIAISFYFYCFFNNPRSNT